MIIPYPRVEPVLRRAVKIGMLMVVDSNVGFHRSFS